MKTTHTPGPWKIADDKKLDASLWHHLPSIAGANGAMIAGLAMGGAKGDANACLIAAAPAMLTACEQALESMDARNEDMGLDVIRQTLRAAIARAKGRV